MPTLEQLHVISGPNDKMLWEYHYSEQKYLVDENLVEVNVNNMAYSNNNGITITDLHDTFWKECPSGYIFDNLIAYHFYKNCDRKGVHFQVTFISKLWAPD